MNALTKIAAGLLVAGILGAKALPAVAHPGHLEPAPAPAPHYEEDNWYAVVTIENPTSMTIHYSFRWGDGEWEDFTLEPGDVRWHSWEYDYANQNESPRPYVRYDRDLTDAFEMELYHLEAFASPYQLADYGKLYAFGVVWEGDYLQLRGY